MPRMRLTTHVKTTIIFALVRVMNDRALNGYKMTMNLQWEIKCHVNHPGQLFVLFFRLLGDHSLVT